jgi:glycosyltransferase involved in cell wall biosynthesis
LVSQLALYRVLVRIVRQQRLDVVVGVDPFLAGLLGLAVARRTKRPFVLRVSANHDEIYGAAGALGMPRFLPTYAIQRWVGRFLFKRADLVTAINENNLAYARNNGVRKQHAIIPISGNIESLHWLPPTERPYPAPLLRQLGIPDDKPLLLYFGRLIKLKHPDDAVRAMAAAIKVRGRAHGIVAGAGMMEPELKMIAASLGVAGRIHFVGHLGQAQLSQLLPACIVLSPSAGQMAVLESALGGAALVAYDRDFQPEFIENGRNGFIVPFRDWPAMAKRAEQLLTNPNLFDTMSKASRQSALEYMAPERTREAERAAFARVLPGLGAQR